MSIESELYNYLNEHDSVTNIEVESKDSVYLECVLRECGLNGEEFYFTPIEILYIMLDYSFAPLWFELNGEKCIINFRRGDSIEIGRASLDENPSIDYPV